MTELPLNGIFPSLVANAIGIGSTNIGNIMTSNRVNIWGYDSPDAAEQSQFWGVKNPQPWYTIGAFRRYKHLWRCYGLGEIEIGGDIGNYNAGYIEFKMAVLNSLPSEADTLIEHLFDLYIDRTGVFGGDKELVAENLLINTNQSRRINIDPATGKFDVIDEVDGHIESSLISVDGPLTQDSTLHFRLVHKSSPDRKWDARHLTVLLNESGSSQGGSITKEAGDAWKVGAHIGIFSLPYAVFFGTDPINNFTSASDAYISTDTSYTYYAASPQVTIGATLYSDAAMSSPIVGLFYWFAISLTDGQGNITGQKAAVQINNSGVITDVQYF